MKDVLNIEKDKIEIHGGMDDLLEILEINRSFYKKYNMEIPKLKEYVLGFRWAMPIDENGKMSQSLRVGKEDELDKYKSFIKSILNKPLDECIEECIKAGAKYRTLAVSISSLMSKSFNSEEKLLDRGIIRTKGLKFDYETKDKKIGVIGFGLYNKKIKHDWKEFHAFDLRPEKAILSTRINEEGVKTYPKNVYWHLGENALANKDVLADLDIVIMTGSTVVNNTYKDLLASCKNAEIRGIYGPSSELCPDYLFDLGFNYIFSTSIRDSAAYLDATLCLSPEYNEFDFMDLYELRKK